MTFGLARGVGERGARRQGRASRTARLRREMQWFMIVSLGVFGSRREVVFITD